MLSEALKKMIPIKLISKFFKPGQNGQWIAAISASLCALSAAQGLAWTAGALPKIRRGEAGFTLDINQQSWAASILFVGNILSPVPSSYLMEKFGRRNSLCIGIWLNVIAFIIIATTADLWSLCVARILKGIWIGIVFTVVPVYIGECVDPRIRGVLGTAFGVFLFVGSLMVSFIGSYCSYKFNSWFSVMFSAVIGLNLSLIPESPYFFVSKGDMSSAKSSLAWLKGNCDEAFLKSIEESIRKSKECKSSFLDIFKKASSRKAFIIVAILGAVQRSAGLSVLLSYTSVTLPDYIVSAENFTIILNVVWIVACITSAFIMDRFDRRILMGFSCAGTAISMLGATAWFYVKDQMKMDIISTTWLAYCLLIVHGASFSIGLVSIPTMMQGEVFSPEIKSKASSLVSAWVAMVSGVCLNIYLPLEAAVGSYSNFLICSVSSVVGLFTTLFYMIETRGRTLEDILDQLEDTNNKNKTTEVTRF